MGLYDHIRCRYPLPDGFTEDIEYQTKDTDEQYLGHYTITEDGRLIHHTWRGEITPKSERPFPEAPDDSLKGMCGILRRVPTGDVEIPFHGALEFYASNISGNSTKGYITEDGQHACWRSYTALFDHGKLLKIEGGAEVDPVPPITRGEFFKRDDDGPCAVRPL